MAGALASNAGDRYHFIYAVRKMIDMLYLRNNLKLIIIEGVSPLELTFDQNLEIFLGIDLIEYYGDANFQNADKIVLVQIKYSPTNPNGRWTLNRLCKNKKSSSGKEKAGTSVLRKLSDAFYFYYGKFKENTSKKVNIKLYTNQTLNDELCGNLQKIKSLISDKSDTNGSKILRKEIGETRKILDQIKDITKLNWKQIAAFLKSWDLSGFGGKLISEVQADLFSLAKPFGSDIDIYIERLISFVQEHAMPYRETSISRETVLNVLNLREIDFFPAPTQLRKVENLIFSNQINNLFERINYIKNGFLIVHGISGTGKTISLQLINQKLNKSMVIYDCFSNGEGMIAGKERYPYKKFFVQIINEIDSIFHTNILATTKLNYNHLMNQFNKSIESGSQIAKDQGIKLIIAIDAIDNAILAKKSDPFQKDDSFIPILWKIKIPENCIIIITLRSENLCDLVIETEYEEFEIFGFNKEETRIYLSSCWELNQKLLDHIFKRTNGNPRVLSILYERYLHERPPDIFKFVSDVAKESAFKYYKKELNIRLKSDKEKFSLAIILEVRSLISPDTLSHIIELPFEEITQFLNKLYFGIHISENNKIIWKNQDFLEYSRIFIGDICKEAQSKLADYCKENFGRNVYANLNLSHHLYLAERYNELLEYWLSENRLRDHIKKSQPFKENVLLDLQYSLLASIKVKNLFEFLKILIITTDVLQGRDIFNMVMSSYPQIAIECNYIDQILEFIEEKKYNTLKFGEFFAIAKSLSEKKVKLQLAKKIFQRGLFLLEEHKKQFPKFYLDVLDNYDILNIAIYKANTNSLEFALEWLKSLEPQEKVFHSFILFISSWGPGKEKFIFQNIKRNSLNEYQFILCLLGLLAIKNVNLEKKEIKEIFRLIKNNGIKSIQKIEKFQDLIPNILENLILKELIEEAKYLINYWDVIIPNSPSTFFIKEFLKKKSFETILNIKSFNPEDFKISSHPGYIKEMEKNSHEIIYTEQKIQNIMKRLYPSFLLKNKILVKYSEKEIIEDIKSILDSWTQLLQNNQNISDEFIITSSNVLEVIISLPSYNIKIVKEILEINKKLKSSFIYRRYNEFARILSLDGRYHSQAEKLINKCREIYNSPNIDATTAVNYLLNIYYVAAEINKNLSFEIFLDARFAANKISRHVYGYTLSLFISGSISKKENEINNEQLKKISAIVKNLKNMGINNEMFNMNNLLSLIANLNVKFAFKILNRSEESNLKKSFNWIYPIFNGMLEGKKIPVNVLWPLIHFIDNFEDAINIFHKTIINLFKSKENFQNCLKGYVKYIKINVPRKMKENVSENLLKWAEANDLIENLTLNFLKQFYERLLEFKHFNDNIIDNLVEEQKYTPLYELFLNGFSISPQKALSILLDAELKQVQELSILEFEKISELLIESLTSFEIKDFLPIIELWCDESRISIYFKIINNLAKNFSTSKDIITELRKSFQGILKLSTLRKYTHLNETKLLEIIPNYLEIDKEAIIITIMSKITSSLSEFHSEELFILISQLLKFIDSNQNYEIFNILLDWGFEKLKIINAHEFDDEKDNEKNPFQSFIHFLSNYLCHPRLAIRWKALYSLIDIVLEKNEPTLEYILQELEDTNHKRWITKREWVCFLLHHLSIQIPSALRPYYKIIMRCALNHDFPHAKIRYHIKEILLNIEKNVKETLSKEDLSKVEFINKPKAYYTTRDFSWRIPYEGISWRERRDTSFNFDIIDTLPYWYSPLSHCFALHRCHIADIAYDWIVNKWNITNEMCTKDRDEYRYRWTEISNDHGSEPSVESLKKYAERHGMFMAAGKLIDSKPVMFYEGHIKNEWEEWMRYRLRAADPSLISRYLETPPLTPENYGFFTIKYEEWIKIDEKEFQKELFIPNQPNWLSVSGDTIGKFKDRYFKIKVMSALITPKTSTSFIRLMKTQNRITFFPYIKLDYYHDTILTEFEKDYKDLESNYLINEDYEVKKKFKLIPWLIYWHQELPFHSDDPKWFSLGRNYYFPGIKFCNIMGISRGLNEFNWYKNNKKMAYLQIWNILDDINERNSDYIEGHRLIIDKEIIGDFLKKIHLNLVFIVSIERTRPYYLRKSYSDFNRGATIRAYILNQNGEFM